MRTTCLALCMLAAQAAVVEYDFVVENTLVMQYGQYKAYFRDGVMYYKNSSSNTGANGMELKVPEADVAKVLVVDGFYRAVPTVNGQVPGPAIIVTEGDEVVVRMTNKLENQPVTLHWHGMYQRGSNFMDGVSQITQCPTLPGQSFTYRFIAEPVGTHSWHSHHGIQRPDGLFGPLIVKEKTPSFTRSVLCKHDNFLMTLSLWYHQSTPDVYHKRLGPGFFSPSGDIYKWGRSVDGKLVSEIPFKTGLVNGKGRFNGTQAPYEVYNVVPGDTHCFRIVNAGLAQSLRVSIDGHELQVFASDGFEFQTVTAESVVVNPGESYDISILPNVTTGDGNFWVRARTMEEGADHEALAILRYPSAPVKDPVTTRTSCTAATPCNVLNCPFPAYAADSFQTCQSIHTVRNMPRAGDPTRVDPTKPIETYFLNFGFSPLSINNRQFATPHAPPGSQPDAAKFVPCEESCDTTPCVCTHHLNITYGTQVQFVFTNTGPHGYGMHPAHFHGHSFEVMYIGYPPYDPVTGHVCEWPAGAPHPTCRSTLDIACKEGTACAVASWAPGREPPLNNTQAPLKDTVIVPPGGYAVVRYVADNPGYWHLHCHMAHHQFYGLSMIINEAPEHQAQFPAPPGFPKCGDFEPPQNYASTSRDKWASMAGL